MVGMTDVYMEELQTLLKNTWHKGRKQFTGKELVELIGKSTREGMAVRAINHLMTNMYYLAAFALRENKEFLGKISPNLHEHLKKIKEPRRHAFETHGMIKTSTKMVHSCNRKCNIRKITAAEINFLC